MPSRGFRARNIQTVAIRVSDTSFLNEPILGPITLKGFAYLSLFTICILSYISRQKVVWAYLSIPFLVLFFVNVVCPRKSLSPEQYILGAVRFVLNYRPKKVVRKTIRITKEDMAYEIDVEHLLKSVKVENVVLPEDPLALYNLPTPPISKTQKKIEKMREEEFIKKKFTVRRFE